MSQQLTATPLGSSRAVTCGTALTSMIMALVAFFALSAVVLSQLRVARQWQLVAWLITVMSIAWFTAG